MDIACPRVSDPIKINCSDTEISSASPLSEKQLSKKEMDGPIEKVRQKNQIATEQQLESE